MLPKLICLGLLVGSMQLTTSAFAQKKESTRLKFYYYKLDDHTKRLSMELTAGRGRNSSTVAGAEIVLYHSANDSTAEMARVITDSIGSVELYVEPEYNFLRDEEGFTTIEAAFDGNDTLRSSSNDVEVKDIDIQFAFEIEDSVKVLRVTAQDGLGMPAEEIDINIGVQRLYSVLPLDRIETDENGTANLEFPDDIPGDSLGMLTVVAFMDDSDDYGSVTKRGQVAWGIPVDHKTDRFYRELWTDEAPLWMVAAVFIVLLGAWYHFILSILKLRKVKQLADEGAN
jgi:hypothetical protein